MCDYRAYLKTPDGETVCMEHVTGIATDDEGVTLTSLFGEERRLRAAIHSLAMVDGRIVLTPLGGADAGGTP